MKSLFKNFLKDDPIEATLAKYSLLDDSTVILNFNTLVKYYQKMQCEQKESNLIDALIIHLDKKKSFITKLKILSFLFHISKVSTYDVVELITKKKFKAFTEEKLNKKQQDVGIFEATLANKELYVRKFLLVPLYNYMIKLSTNEELYKICQAGSVPCDDIFRKGNKIRYVWVFKIYNLLNLLVPMLSPLLIILEKFPKDGIFIQILENIKMDIHLYTSFITKCIQETSVLNPFLLPYNDCLQYYESVKEYRLFRSRYETLLEEVGHFVPKPEIKFTDLDENAFAELDVLASRIQLISVSLRATSNKENQRMITEFNEKVEKEELRLNTIGDC